MEGSGYDVEVMLDKPRTLRFGWKYLMAFERETKLQVSDVLSEGRIGFFTTAAFIWAGLLWKDRGLTLERTADMLQKWVENGGDFTALWLKIREALKRAKLVQFAEPEAPGANGAATDDETEGDDADPTPAPESGSA